MRSGLSGFSGGTGTGGNRRRPEKSGCPSKLQMLDYDSLPLLNNAKVPDFAARVCKLREAWASENRVGVRNKETGVCFPNHG